MPRGAGGDVIQRARVGPAGEPPDDDYFAGLPRGRFLAAIMRRGAPVWAAIALLGVVTGLGLSVALPPAVQASTTILLTHNPDNQPQAAMLTDLALAQSRAVAQRAVHELGLRQSVSSFLAAYTVSELTDRVLMITVGAPSGNAAMARARAVASAFLAYRAREFRAQQRLVLDAFGPRITRAQARVDSVAGQVVTALAQPRSAARRARLKHLEAQSRSANRALGALQLGAIDYQVTTATEVGGSAVLDPPGPIAHAHRFLSAGLLIAILYAGMGLIAGLAVGLGLVVVRALVSDRLRRRDDVAHALGVPVRLSVGPVRGLRWRPGRGGLAGTRRPDVQRIAAHLRDALPRRGGQPAALAVVAVDDPPVAALSVVAAALSCVREGQQVVLADLCPGAPAARLLGVREPGTGPVSVEGGQLVVVVPGQDDVGPAGPLRSSSPPAGVRPRRWPGPAPRRMCCSRWRSWIRRSAGITWLPGPVARWR